MQDVRFIEENGVVVMQKKLWHDSELILAKCFSFDVNIEAGTITASLAVTSQRSLLEFIRISFKSFSEALAHEEYRNKFYADIENHYKLRNQHIDSILVSRIPYYDKFYQHQKDVLYESFFKKYNFYALDMGLGKTLVSASMSRACQYSRTVIICPSAVKWNWFKDLTNKFGFNQLYFTMLDAAKRRTFIAFQERFIILNYDILHKWEKHLSSIKVDHFILDEAKSLKNHNALRTKNTRKLIEKFPDARVTFLDGTPISNRVNDVFSYLKIINHELGLNHKKFLDEFTITSSGRGGERVTGGKNLQELNLKLSNFMIRKTKEDCLDLPGKIFLSYKFELDDYRDEYSAIIKEMSEQKSISSLTGNIHSLNIITAKAKKQGIINLAEDIIEGGRKVVIFGGYKDPMSDLQKYFGHRCVKVDGSVESFMRNEYVEKFIKDDECVVFLGNWDAAGVGINLVNASDIIVHNFPLTPAKLYQGLDRCDRIGQTRAVNVHYTFCEDSIDEYIYEILVDKEGDINAVIDQGKEVVLRENINEILIKKLLKRDDIIFENRIPKTHGEDKAEEIIETEKQGNTTAGVLFENMPAFGERVFPDNSNIKSSVVQHEQGGVGAENSSAERTVVSNDSGSKSANVQSGGSTNAEEAIGGREGQTDASISKSVPGQSHSISKPNEQEKELSGGQGKNNSTPKYYLLVHPESDSLFISNEAELESDLNAGCDCLFEDEDVQKVICEGRHAQILSTNTFNADYVPNPVELSPPHDKTTAVVDPIFTDKKVFPSAIEDITISSAVAITEGNGLPPLPPGFL